MFVLLSRPVAPTQRWFGLFTVVVALGLLSLAFREVHAQGWQRRTILVLAPGPAAPTDSAFARELGAAVRERLASELGRDARVIRTDEINDMLMAAGFEPNTVLGAELAGMLAQALGGATYLVGTLQGGDQPTVKWRIVKGSNSGWSGWVTVVGSADDDARRLAEKVVDALKDRSKAAEHARTCYQHEAAGEFSQARERAARAHAMYPDYPSAALCAYQVFLQTNAPADSLIWALETAVLGDSLLKSRWLRLADLYQEVGDQDRAQEIRQRFGGVADPPDPPADTTDLYPVVTLSQPPERISSPPIMYPRLLKDAGIEGDVTLEFVIGVDGRVEPSSIKVISSPHSDLSSSARAVIEDSEFRPGKVDGKAVRTLVQTVIGFYIGGGK
jgi:protein TonB